MYIIQLKAPQNTHSFFRLKNNRHGTQFTYELKVQHLGKWNSRPMGISPIGEDAGAKSTCFKVIYDEVLVVKIPRNPIYDFVKYIEVIRNERKIAHTLQPDIQCIVPAVSTILRKIPLFSEGMYWVPEEVENKCIERLRHFPTFQQYLKLESEFVFFMDISKYSFLVQLLDNMYNLKEKVNFEIIKHPEFLSKFQKFEERYGIEHTSVWLHINKIFQEYQMVAASLLKKHGLDTTVHEYKRKKWFLSFLAEKKIVSDDSCISDSFLNELNKAIIKLTTPHAGVFNEYKKMVRSYVKKETFAQAKLQISEIVAGILRLLAILREKKVTIRDLKPDNIFVSSDSPEAFTTSSHRQKVFLGLIDLETAISIDITKHKKLEQPLPGGTPSYATPSNFVPNQMLEKLFQNVPRILHIQDWHASLCMIYMTVTGELLFNGSKNLLYDLINNIQNIGNDQKDYSATFEKQNRLFWKSAKSEFMEKTRAKDELLDDIEIMLSHRVCAMFLEETYELKNGVNLKIQNILNSQKLFKLPQHINSLLDSSPEMVCRFREKWQKINLHSKCSSKLYGETMFFFQELEDSKKLAAKLEQWIEIFHQRPLIISVGNLLDFMFNVVTETMYSTDAGNNRDS